MRIKSFYGDTMEMAFQLAAKEFGDEALILNSRSTPTEFRHFGAFELVCAASDEPETARPEEKGAAGALTGSEHLKSASVEEPIVALPKSVGKVLSPGEFTNALSQGNSEVKAWRPPELSSRAKAAGATEWICLVGLPGGGKTTVGLKIAIEEGLKRKRKTCILSGNAHRVGGDAMLKQYAELAGIATEPIEEGREQEQFGKLSSKFDLVILDTAPTSGEDPAFDRVAELAGLREGRSWQMHLVLPVTLDHAVLGRICERLLPIGPTHLLPTFVDLGMAGRIPELVNLPKALQTRWCSAGADVLTGLYSSGELLKANPKPEPATQVEQAGAAQSPKPVPDWSSLLNRYRNSAAGKAPKANGSQFAA